MVHSWWHFFKRYIQPILLGTYSLGYASADILRGFETQAFMSMDHGWLTDGINRWVYHIVTDHALWVEFIIIGYPQKSVSHSDRLLCKSMTHIFRGQNKQKLPRLIWVLNVIFLRALTIFSGPRISYFVNGLITVSLSPQILQACLVLMLRAQKNISAGHWPEGPPYFNPCIS